MNLMPISLTLPNTLYHGSAQLFKRVDVSKGRPHKDFGKGFYIALSADQAIGMMHKKYREAVSRRRDHMPGEYKECLYRVELDLELLKTLRVRFFETADAEWLDFILMCRPSLEVPHNYDVVIGPTADDDTNRALKFYYDGAYGDPGSLDAKRMLLRVLEADNLGRQLFIASQSVADRLIVKFEAIAWRNFSE